MKYLMVDYDECRGCHSCALACSFGKTREFNINRSNISIVSFPKKGFFIPVICEQCLKPVCEDVCPVEPEKAIHRDKDTGAMIIDEDLCIGCKLCISACPIGAPWLDEKNSKIMKCDLCDGDPRCVKHCNYGALHYVKADEATMKKRREGAYKISMVLDKLN